MNIVSVYPCIPGVGFELDNMLFIVSAPPEPFQYPNPPALANGVPLTRAERDYKVTHRAFIPIGDSTLPLAYIRKIMKDFTAINESELLYELTDAELALFILKFS